MTPSSSDDAGALISELVAALNDHDLDRAVSFFASTPHNHGRPTTPEGMRALFAAQRAAIPDFHHEVEAQFIAGNVVTTRSMLSGTHVGTVPEPFTTRMFNGALAGIEPTGRRFRIQAIHIWDTADGLIAGHWACRDDLGMRAQVSDLPS